MVITSFMCTIWSYENRRVNNTQFTCPSAASYVCQKKKEGYLLQFFKGNSILYDALIVIFLMNSTKVGSGEKLFKVLKARETFSYHISSFSQQCISKCLYVGLLTDYQTKPAVVI